jgi:hypothetical protein
VRRTKLRAALHIVRGAVVEEQIVFHGKVIAPFGGRRTMVWPMVQIAGLIPD